MWSYYGAKTNIIDLYPAPKHDLIIEPFAGTARYALKYFDRDVILIEKYEVVSGIWKWLQQCSEKDVLSLPRFLKKGDRLDEMSFSSPEAKHLIGFLMGFSTTKPRSQATIKYEQRPNFLNFSLKRMAANLYKIKHWKIVCGSYEQAPSVIATWFIDPPYQFGGHSYVESSKNINFSELASWSKKREGQVIVCENNKANWMDFVPLGSHRTVRGLQKEVIWTNEQTVFNNKQLQLL